MHGIAVAPVPILVNLAVPSGVWGAVPSCVRGAVPSGVRGVPYLRRGERATVNTIESGINCCSTPMK